MAKRLTENELNLLRNAAREQLAREGETTLKFTCDGCPSRFECEWVYDLYNTDGDCLAEK